MKKNGRASTPHIGRALWRQCLCLRPLRLLYEQERISEGHYVELLNLLK